MCNHRVRLHRSTFFSLTTYPKKIMMNLDNRKKEQCSAMKNNADKEV